MTTDEEILVLGPPATRLTRRGRAVLYGLVGVAFFTFGFLSIPLGIWWTG